ncbi:polysaccharide biosynthesis protein [Micromonospora sp. DR5-3]|uniref:polysaccharide biosynthesis protein n=1 Tax=unclassified Micromonospora TaxID=2617518 RepID=UPI0011D72D45|nr:MULTISPECIES: polysaccharide biosynthesis protein [unclassified Micromonospora]MCW3814979.1 polysaccharide biosynthesis protein [Micromonospora sp. DR5-3]TYC25305.1 NAD-dependent epimerase/dehydratase family protein [Micromonospora sp. MP36]
MTDSTTGRRVLITGGTGSFGRTMVRRLLDRGVAEVRVLSRDEAKQDAMRREIGDDRVRYHVGDVRDLQSVLLASRNVDYVFHAAALKQVPSCEFFPLEAVRTNIAGSANVVEAAEANDVSSVVLLSTDKAVCPVNAMGLSKALMEKVAQAHARNHPGSRTVVSCVRYGNVMYSRGSVIPLFIEQIKAGRTPTVTDSGMTRFLMSLAESVELVEHAFQRASSGDVFIRKAPACTIGDLAEAICQLFGVPAKLDVIGVRHGEKQHETLATREELARAEDFGDFFRVPMDTRDLNYALYVSEGELRDVPVADFTSANAPRLAVPEIVELLKTLPEVRAELALRDPVLAC